MLLPIHTTSSVRLSFVSHAAQQRQTPLRATGVRRSTPRQTVVRTLSSETSSDTSVEEKVAPSAPSEGSKKTPVAVPSPVPVKHSSAFVSRQSLSPSSLQTKFKKRPTETEIDSSNALQSALSRLDESLDEFETAKPPVAKAAWAVGKLTTAASQDPRIQAAAKGAVQVGSEAVKAAIPVGKKLGQWALKKAITVVNDLDEANNAPSPAVKKAKQKNGRLKK